MPYKPAHLPILKMIVPLLIGISLFNYIECNFTVLLCITVAWISICIISHFSVKNKTTKNVNALFVYACLILIGGLMITSTRYDNQKNHYAKTNAEYAQGIIAKPIEEKEKTYKTVIEIEAVIDSNKNKKNADGNLLVYIEKDSIAKQLEIGDEILFRLHHKPIGTPQNIGQFDYKKYLKHKRIFHQQYLIKSDLTITQKHKSLFVKRISNTISIYVQAILKKYITNSENYALADGILLGHRADIDVELYNAFAYTGILHILSVSGLHVGIIYGMLLFFLSFIQDRSKRIKIAKFVFTLGFIWLFTFVTGFSAACVRAAILFTLLNFGRLNKEYVNNLNILCGAALLQMLIDPNNVFDIGFQLSYLAMLGLFIFYKPIYAIYYSPIKIVDKIWSLWSASIAAQLFTVPLSIYYFGNFPTYFLFANIFAIPLSAVILWLSIALIPFSYIPFLAVLIGQLDTICIRIFIQLTYFFSKLPLGKINNLYITKWQLILLFIGVLCLAYFIIKQNTKYLISALLIFIVCIFMSYQNNVNQIRKRQLVLYSLANNFVLANNANGKQTLYIKDTITQKSFSFSIQNSHRILGIKEYHSIFLTDSVKEEKMKKENDLLFIQDKSIYFMNRKNTRKTFKTPINIDYLLICDNCYLNIDSIKSNYNFKKILLSSENDRYHITTYKKLLDEHKIPYHDLSEKYLAIDL